MSAIEIEERITRARKLLDQGDEKSAARELTDAVVLCRDPAQAVEIRQLADRGIDMAGRFGKSRWKEVQRLADVHGAASIT
jgi:hypothetical protein